MIPVEKKTITMNKSIFWPKVARESPGEGKLAARRGWRCKNSHWSATISGLVDNRGGDGFLHDGLNDG